MFVVHVLEEETGRERMLAVVRAVSRPVVRPRELVVREWGERGAPAAKAPTVPPPPALAGAQQSVIPSARARVSIYV